MNKIVIFLFLIFSVLGTQNTYAQAQNSGFVPASIWYSIDPFEEGAKIKIYTFIFNGDKRELTGTVLFFNKDTLLGKKDFVIPPERARDVFIDWTAEAGKHKIFAKIENAKFVISKGQYENATLKQVQTKESERTVDKKITTKEPEKEIVDSNSATTAPAVSVENIKKVIGENTPEFIEKPIIASVAGVEDFRSSTGIAVHEKKVNTNKEINALKEKEGNMFLKPFKYTQFFLLSILSFILNNIYIFYIILALLMFLILRYIWRKIF